MFKMESVDDLWNHIAYVLAYAPDRFPHRDFLPPHQQMNLPLAFQQLRQGVEIAHPEPSFADKRQVLYQLLDRCHAAFLAGKEDEAGDLLNEFQANIFKEQ